MTITFEDATPVKVSGTGRKAEPNPFADVVKEIAGKKIGENDKGLDPEAPVAKKFTESLRGTEEDKTTLNRIRRQLQEAGNLCNPQVTVRVHVESDTKGKKAGITFWTVSKQARPRNKDAASNEPQTASTPQSVAPANA